MSKYVFVNVTTRHVISWLGYYDSPAEAIEGFLPAVYKTLGRIETLDPIVKVDGEVVSITYREPFYPPWNPTEHTYNFRITQLQELL